MQLLPKECGGQADLIPVQNAPTPSTAPKQSIGNGKEAKSDMQGFSAGAHKKAASLQQGSLGRNTVQH